MSLHKYSQSNLPNELMFTIFELVANDRFILAKLARLNTAFRPIAEQILYRNMTHWLGSSSQDLFLHAILNNTRLASYVQRFAVIDYRVASREWQVREEDPIWDLMASCMGLMTRLKEVIVDMEWNNIPLSKFLPCFAKLDLQAFTWYGKGLKNTNKIVDFLGKNHWKSLQVLKISLDGVKVGDSNGEDWCKGLIRLEGDGSAIRHILPGRHIQELGWYPEKDMSVGDIDLKLAEALQSVTALSISYLMSFGNVFLDGLFQNVQHLRILNAENAQIFLPRLLRRLPSLHEVSVDSKSRNWPISKTFSLCPSLECMYIVHPGSPVEEDKYDEDPLNLGVHYYRYLPDSQPKSSVQPLSSLKKGPGAQGHSTGYYVDNDHVQVDGSMSFRHYLSFNTPVAFQADDYINKLPC